MEQILLNLLEVSLGASAVIVLMLLVAPLAGRTCSAKWRYWVWLLLAIRLLLPFNMELPSAPVTVTVPQPLTQTVEVALPEASPVEVVPAVPEDGERDASILLETQPLTPDVSVETKSLWQPSRLEILGLVWVVGATASLIWQGVSYVKYQQNARLWNRPVTDEKVLGIYEELCTGMKLRNIPQLLQNRRNQSPMMIGLLKPAILLPEISYSEDDYVVILSHELNHYRRHDLWYKLLLVAARCVHWFNPLVWLMLREAENDLEITCDEAVVKNSDGDQRAQYCEAILRIMCRGKGGYALLSTGFHGGKKVLQRRFTAVLNEKASRGFVLGTLALVLVLLCGALVACEVSEAGQPVVEPPAVQEEVEETASIPQDPEFWVEKAKELYLLGFQLDDHTSHKEKGSFFNFVIADRDFYDAEVFKQENGTYEFPLQDIVEILEQHIPADGFDPVKAFNDDGNENYPFNVRRQVYVKEFLGGYGGVRATEAVTVDEKGDTLEILLASYDVEKYYAQPQEKVLLETYRFSVRLSEDSWYITGAGIEAVTPETPAEETTPAPSAPVQSVPAVSTQSGSGSNSGEPFKLSFHGLDVHATEAYETVSFYTADPNAIRTILEALDWEGRQAVPAKQELHTHDINLSGNYVRLITDNMEQLYIYQDHDQALYRDLAGNRAYYDVDERAYDHIFALAEEVSQWKRNPMTDERAEPFDENYTTLDVYGSESPEKLTYSLTIRTFCEMLVEDLNWYAIAERSEVTEYLSPIDLSDGHYLRISTDTGRHLYIYKDQPYGVYYTGHGNEHYYKLPGGTYQRVLKLLESYSLYQKQGAKPDVFPFQRDFTNVTVSLHDKSLADVEPEAVALDKENSFRMMAGIPTGYFVRAEKKEELSLEEGTYVLMENSDGQKLAIYEGKSQAKYWAADGKVAYYELGADYYDIAKMVANECVRKQRGAPLEADVPVGDLSKTEIKLFLTSFYEGKGDTMTTEKTLQDAADREAAYLLIKNLKKSNPQVNPNTPLTRTITVSLTDSSTGKISVYEFSPDSDIVFCRGVGSYDCPVGAYNMLFSLFKAPGKAGIFLTATRDSWPIGTEQINFILKNNQDQFIGGGDYYTLEKKENGTWVSVQEISGKYNTDLGVVHPPYAEISKIVDLTRYGALEAGTYRITMEGDGNPQAEFCLDDLSKLNPETAKPVIYLYPEEEMEVSIQLDYNGQLTTTYPAYNNGWTVTAKPDGTITDPKGREYYCLFWEGISNVEYDLSSGFVVKGGETEAFLETALKQLGLTDKEANEFLIYWLPKMENNPYNLISFQQETYTDNTVLDIQPKPDSILRVFMAWKGLDAAIEVPSQELPGFERKGFTLVEWGGSEME